MTVSKQPAIASPRIAPSQPESNFAPRLSHRRRVRVDSRQVWLAIATLTLITVLAFASPAFAHHPFGGTTPQTGLAGLLSGLGHPVIGADHFVFVLVGGLLSALLGRPAAVTGAFLLATLAGVGLHLMALDLPALELTISLSVLLLGTLVAWGRTLSLWPVLVVTTAAGLFRGYAYGEAIVGAEPTPLLGYLLGLTVIQGAIALGTYFVIGKHLPSVPRLSQIRAAGFIACGAGAAFLSGVVLG